jgi:two-component SAPR family response regulator
MEETSFGTHVQFFGTFSLNIDGRPVRQWRGGRARSLFQYLLVNRNKLVLKERLYEVLWPHAEWSSHSSSLKVAVHALRQVLNGQLGQGNRRLEVIYQDFGYVLKANGGVWIDYDEFEKLTNEASIAESRKDIDAAVRAHEKAISLYCGDFLIGESAGWVDEQREWLRGSALRSLHFLATVAIRRGDDERALQYCRSSLEIEGCHEETYRMVMSIFGRRGERGQVQRWYDLCVDRLRTQLGVAPSPETDRLFWATLHAARARDGHQLAG